MSFPIDITLGNPDPALKLTNYSDLFTVIRQNLSGESPQDVQTFVYGYDTPTPEQQELVWLRLDSDGRLKGMFNFFSGVWVREEPPVSARLGFFVGDPTVYFDGTGLGLKGAGPVAEDYWGWALMNGNNGTPNLSDRFLVMGRMDNVDITGFSDGWRTNITGTPLGVGGAAEITLDESTTYSPVVEVGMHDATDEAQDDTGDLYGKIQGGDTVTLSAGNAEPNAISIVNPFYALAMVIFVGYTG